MRQLYYLCRCAGIVRGFRHYFKGTELSEWEIEVIRMYRRP